MGYGGFRQTAGELEPLQPEDGKAGPTRCARRSLSEEQLWAGRCVQTWVKVPGSLLFGSVLHRVPPVGQWQLRRDWLLSPPACIFTTPHFCSPGAQVSLPHKGAPRPSAPGPSLRFQAAHTRGQHVPTAPAQPTRRAAAPARLRMLRASARRTAARPRACAAHERGRVLHVLPESWTGPGRVLGLCPLRTDPGARVGARHLMACSTVRPPPSLGFAARLPSQELFPR